MKKIVLMVVLSGLAASASAATIYSPASGVVCDKKAGFCVDHEGISRGLTSRYLGERADTRLDKTLGEGMEVNLGEYTLSNGVHCDSKAKQCYKDRFFPRTPDKQETTLTQQIFGKGQ